MTNTDFLARVRYFDSDTKIDSFTETFLRDNAEFTGDVDNFQCIAIICSAVVTDIDSKDLIAVFCDENKYTMITASAIYVTDCLSEVFAEMQANVTEPQMYLYRYEKLTVPYFVSAWLLDTHVADTIQYKQGVSFRRTSCVLVHNSRGTIAIENEHLVAHCACFTAKKSFCETFTRADLQEAKQAADILEVVYAKQDKNWQSHTGKDLPIIACQTKGEQNSYIAEISSEDKDFALFSLFTKLGGFFLPVAPLEDSDGLFYILWKYILTGRAVSVFDENAGLFMQYLVNRKDVRQALFDYNVLSREMD